MEPSAPLWSALVCAGLLAWHAWLCPLLAAAHVAEGRRSPHSRQTLHTATAVISLGPRPQPPRIRKAWPASSPSIPSVPAVPATVPNPPPPLQAIPPYHPDAYNAGAKPSMHLSIASIEPMKTAHCSSDCEQVLAPMALAAAAL